MDPANYDALYLPGGRAPEIIRLDKKVINIVRYFIDHQKPIAAQCHGLMYMASAGGIEGRNLTGFPGIANELKLSGAIFHETKPDDALVDGNIVTA